MVAYVRCAQVASTSQVEAPQSVRTVQQTLSRPQAARLLPLACATRGTRHSLGPSAQLVEWANTARQVHRVRVSRATLDFRVYSTKPTTAEPQSPGTSANGILYDAEHMLYRL